MFKLLRNERGVALLITLFAILIMIFMAVEISYNTHVELKVGATQVDRLKAYYLARSGIQLSLLRINVYKTVLQRFGAQLGNNKSDLDLIWQFPFSWPPMLPPDISDLDKENVKSAVQNSFIDGAFTTTIEGESGKIDINDLASPAEKLRESTKAQLVQMIQNRLDQDDDWAKDHQNLKPLEIVNNIADWIDEDHDSQNGGTEDTYYMNTDPPIKPPNRSMKTIDELHMVAGVTDEIYNLIAPKVTVYGIKGINVNYANKDVIRAIDKQITDEIANAVIERRSDPRLGPFKDVNDFVSFLGSQGVRTDTFNKQPEIPLIFDSEYNFRIKSTGIYGKAQRDIVAIVYDFDRVKDELSKFLAASASPSPGQSAAAPTPTPNTGASPSTSASAGGNAPAPKNAPQIVFWQEF